MSTIDLHLDDEDLAALIDGTLEEPRRGEVMAHVIDCPDCYEIYASAVAVAGELAAPVAGTAPVVPIRSVSTRRRPWFSRALAGAAAMALAVIGWFVLYPGQVVLLPSAGVLAAALAGSGATRPAVEQLWQGPGRGLGFGGSASPEKLAVRSGALLTDLAVCLNDGRFTDAQIVADRLALVAAPVEPAALAEVRKALGESLQGSAKEAAGKLEGALARRWPAEFSSLGRWAEAGRLAALTHDAAFFRRDDVRAFPDGALRRVSDPVAKREIERVQTVLRRGPPAESDFLELERSFEALLLLY